MSSDWRATPSSHGLLRSRGRKVPFCLLPAGNLLLPSLCLLSVFHLPPFQSLSPRPGCGAAGRRRSSAAASERSRRFAGRARNCSKRWSWQGVRVKQVKGCSHLKKRKDGWRRGVGKVVKTRSLSGMVREVAFTGMFFCLGALLPNDKAPCPWFP